MLLLHIAALSLQFGLTYQLYISTVEGLFEPFAHGVEQQIQVLQGALEAMKKLDPGDSIQRDALELCVKHHSMGFIHLMARRESSL